MIQPLMIGTTELIVIGGAVLLLFGGKKIPLEKTEVTDELKRIDEE